MKSPIILGVDLTSADLTTLSIIGNSEMLAINQDALGIQGRRVKVTEPANTTLGTTVTSLDSVAVLAPCDSSDATQIWKYINESSTDRNLLFITPCSSGSAYQTWNISRDAAGGLLYNFGTMACVDSSLGSGDPAMLGNCANLPPIPPAQAWYWNSSSGHISNIVGTTCLASYNFEGPDVELADCKIPGKFDADQQFILGAEGQLYAQLPTYAQYSMCLTASAWPSGGRLSTSATMEVDSASEPLCLYPYFREEGGWMGVSCTDKAHNGFFTIAASHNSSVTIKSPTAFMMYNTQEGASGPWPGTRYIANGGPTDYAIDLPSLFSPTGAQIQAADTSGIVNDNLVGNVTVGGKYCLALRTAGMLETWTVPLAGGRWAAALLNRSPSPAAIVLNWTDLNAWAAQGFSVTSSERFVVRDIWLNLTMGIYEGSYEGAPVPAHGVTLLTLTPSPLS